MKKTYMTSLAALAILSSVGTALGAFTNTGYTRITDLKSFDTHHNIVLEASTHTCSGSPASSSFDVPADSSADGLMRLATAAFLAGREVNLRYECDTVNDIAIVSGVRVR